ncbi:C39 family peptidase [Geothermobacter ehrlichii]|nr:C39 family peptidase [Geothermobacter ehrlichii]
MRLGSALFITLMTGLLIAGQPACAARFQIRVGGQAWMIRQPVKSLKDLKFDNIVRQKTDFSCGAAALATIMSYFYRDRDVTEERIVRWLVENGDRELIRRRGFSLLDLKHYAENAGYRAAGYRIPVEKLERIRIPTITLLTIKGYTHFVVLNAVRNGKAYIADPAMGHRVIPLDEFATSWNGLVFAVFGREASTSYDLFAGPPAANRIALWQANDLLMRNLFIGAGEFRR